MLLVMVECVKFVKAESRYRLFPYLSDDVKRDDAR